MKTKELGEYISTAKIKQGVFLIWGIQQQNLIVVVSLSIDKSTEFAMYSIKKPL